MDTDQWGAIPAALRARNQWVLWRYESATPGSKPTKVPYCATVPTRRASSTRPDTWASFAVAVAAVALADGIGYVFSPDDPYTGTDLDDCIDDTGVIAPWAQQIIDDQASYTEVSPSGRGVKIWSEGAIPSAVKTAQIEMYDRARYFTVTGQHLAHTPLDIRPAQAALTALHAAHRPDPPADTTYSAPVPPSPRTNGHGAYLDQWAQRKLAGAIEKMTLAQDGEKHKVQLNQCRLLGGVAAHGLLSDSTIEQAMWAAVACRPGVDRGNSLQTIRYAIGIGRLHPLELPEPDPEPTWDAEGHACCPQCLKRLKRAKNGHGWRCMHGKELGFWWEGKDYTPPAPASEPATDAPGLEPPSTALSERIGVVLGALGYTFRLNQGNDNVECNGVPVDDVLRARIRTQMRDRFVKPLDAVEDVILTIAAANAYHPIRDYLTGLTWDGAQHITPLAQMLASSDPPVQYANGQQRPLHHVYLFRWLIGAVAKVLGGHQNMMLVLAGPQDIGKSGFAAWLCSGIPEAFIEAPINVGERDTEVRLMSHLIWEVSELDATTRKADVSALKSLITRKEVSVRKAYGHHDTVKPALVSFIGTLNPANGFLSDETGSRRFWTTTLTGIDWSYTSHDVNQVWAEAVHYYQTATGTPWRLTSDEIRERDRANQQHEIESVLEGWLTRYFNLRADPSCRMSASDIVDHLRSKEIRLTGSERQQAMEIARVLAHHKVPRAKTPTWRGYSGICPKDAE